jgi:hypothetical protein
MEGLPNEGLKKDYRTDGHGSENIFGVQPTEIIFYQISAPSIMIFKTLQLTHEPKAALSFA